MKFSSLCTALGLTTLTLTMNINPSFSQENNTDSSANQVTFFCQQIFDTASGEKIPGTVAWIPQRQVHVRFIAWKSEAFPQWSPEKRCQVVSEKFQKFHQAGLLNYLKTGKNKGYPVICAVKNSEENCNGDNQLFTLKNGSSPQLVLKQLLNIAEGTSSREIFQSTGSETYLNVANFFQNAPVVNVEK